MNEIIYPLTQQRRLPAKQIDKVTYYSKNEKPEATQGTLKQRILCWLRNMDRQEQLNVFSFTSTFRVINFLRMYKLDQQSRKEYLNLDKCPFEVNIRDSLRDYYYVRECNRLINDHFNLQLKAWQFIVDHIYIADYECLFDTIILQADIEQIIENMEIITDGLIYTRLGSCDQNEDEQYYEVNLKKHRTFQTLSERLVEEFEKCIHLKFLQFDSNTNYTKQDKILSLEEIQQKIDLNLQITKTLDLAHVLNEDSQFLNEKNILRTWLQCVKSSDINLVCCENLKQNLKQIFYVPLCMISKSSYLEVANESILQCKEWVNQQLIQVLPLKKPVIDDGTIKSQESGKKKKQKQPENMKLVKVHEQSIEEVQKIFGSSKKSAIIPEVRLFSTQEEERQEELGQVSSEITKRILSNLLEEYEKHKLYKKEKQKKQKNAKKQYISETTSNCTDTQSQLIQQDQEWLEQPKAQNKKQKRKLQEKQRKKEIQEKKKLKQIQEQVQVQQIIEPEEEEETKILETHILVQEITTTTYDEGDFIEVLPKRKPKEKFEQKKKNKNKNKNKKDFRDDTSLQGDNIRYVPQLKKGTSQVQNSYLSDDNTTKKESITKLQKKEININSNRPGLVKAVQKNKSYEDIDKHLLQIIYKQILDVKLTRDVLEINKREIDQYIKYKSSREISILRVQYVVEQFFRTQSVQAQIFGSSVTGLALEDSDVDLVILGLRVYSKQQLYEPMRQLIEQLQKLKWTVSCKHIFTATVPLIKVEIDPSIAFLQFHGQQLFYLMNSKNPDKFNIKPGDPSKNIQIDISFELQIPPYGIHDIYAYHIGLRSTDYTLQLCANYGFTEIAIILKKLLKARNLNDAYTGGISSFCLSLMIAAMGQDTQIGTKLLRFLYKFGCDFDADKWGIYLDETGNHSNFINIENQISTLPLTIYSPINYQIIQTYVTQIAKIQQTFRELYLEIMPNLDCIEGNLQKHLDSKQLLDLYNTNQITKLVDLVQWPISNLLDGYFM